MITRASVDAISRLQSEDWPIISLYLRLDKERIDEDYTIRLKNVLRQAEESIDAIFGFTCFNDVTAPEFLDERNPRPFPDVYGAKSIDTFASR